MVMEMLNPELLARITKGAKDGRGIELEYVDATGETVTRMIFCEYPPHTRPTLDGHFLLYATNEEEETRAFRVDRIKDVTLL